MHNNSVHGKRCSKVMLSGRIWIALLCCAVLAGSCEKEPLEHAQDLIDNYNYAAALELLSGVNESDVNVSRLQLMKLEGLLVEGRTKEGFAALQAARQEDWFESEKWAKDLLNSAGIILREKDRTGEAIALLDTCLALDESLLREVVNISWNRALEYFTVPGTAAFELIRFAARHDKQISGRLKAYNIFFYTRFQDMQEVERYLLQWGDGLKTFYLTYRRTPHSFQELLPFTNPAPSDTTRDGWTFSIESERGKPKVVATVAMDHSKGIPWGTTMESP